jgi:glycosyltransferase involved in cell wall biosynthesis
VSRAPAALGYVVDRAGLRSQTFITNEMSEMLRQGQPISVVAVDQGDGSPLPDCPLVVLRDLKVPRYVHAAHHALWAARSPRRYLAFRRRLDDVRSELGMRPNRIPWLRLPYVASRLRRDGVRSLHAHFAWQGAATALLLAELTGWRWSMILHANDFLARRRNLEVKLATADELVTVCEYNIRFLRDELGVTRPLHLVVCGVELPAAAAPATKHWDVVSVGRLVEKKGFDLLLEAAALLRVDHPDLRLRIIGDGPLLDSLQAQRRELGLEHVVELTGGAPHEEVLEAIAAAEVFCLPARIAADGDRDSMPVVLKEAMARGVPVVATDVVGIPEMVDSEVGRLVPPEDPKALASALSALLTASPAERAALGATGRRRVEERFTLAGEVAKLRDILRLGQVAS